MIEVLIIEGTEKQALRYWPAVPRIGECVEITYNGVPTIAKVKHILWRNQTQLEFRDGKARVAITVEILPD